MRKQFKKTIMDLAAADPSIVLIFGDVSVYLFNEFKDTWPDRFYNMGICENTLISAGAGMASQGLTPFVHTITPFITERSYEQIKLDMCYNGFGGNVVSCGATFDYAWDGATHHAYTDLAILRLLPGMEVLQPGSITELDVLLRSQYNNGKPTYFRLSDHPHTVEVPTKFGKGAVLKNTGSKVTVMTAGPILANVLPACEDLNVNLVYFSTIKPIDKEVISAFKETNILVVQDAFGLAEAIHEVPDVKVSVHGIPDAFCCYYGTLPEIRKAVGLDVAGIRKAVEEKLR